MKTTDYSKLPDISTIAAGWAKMRGTSLRKLSLKMGKSINYLHNTLKNRDAKPSVLLPLSDMLNINLFEYYLALLPENKRTNEREKNLQRKIMELEKELEQVKAERDKYWEALAGK